MTIRVVLIDDHQMLRDALRKLLESDPEFAVVGVAADGHAGIEVVRERRPDVVVMDLMMAGLNGVDATRRIVADLPGTRIVALSAQSGRRWVLSALEAGASGFVLKSDSYAELSTAVRAVHAGRKYLCAAVAGTVVDAQLASQTGGSAYTELSPREREVVQLIAEGLSSRAIANQLNLSPHTVDTHRRNAMRKLDLTSVADLTRYAIREGLTSSDE